MRIIQTMYHFDKPMAFICATILIKLHHILIGLIFITLIMVIQYHIILRRYICSLGCGICSMESDWCKFLGKPSKVYKYFLMLDASGLLQVNLNSLVSQLCAIFYLLPSPSLIGCWYVMTTYLKGSQFTFPYWSVDFVRRRISYISL